MNVSNTIMDEFKQHVQHSGVRCHILSLNRVAIIGLTFSQKSFALFAHLVFLPILVWNSLFMAGIKV